jgi:crotonobetainyl-CoA:carnitine CoA-transferase CaiB-like acyl-CoA transferase
MEWPGALMTRGDPDRPPVIQGGAICEWATGAMAAVGLLTARWKAVRTGAGDLVDVSMLEAALLTLTMYTATWASIAGTPMRANRQMNLPAIHQTKDGYVGFMVVTGQQWLDFCVLAEQPEWLEDEALGRFNRSPRAVPQGVYRTADPLPDGQQDRWVLISVATDQQWEAPRQGEQAAIPQLTARRFWEDVSHPVLGHYTAQEIARLKREGIIGTRPASADSSRGFT